MSYLHKRDYIVVIQRDALSQITQNDNAALSKAENIAQQELQAYLVQRWDTSKEFSDTLVWNSSRSYKPYDRVVLDFDAYSTATSYSAGDTVVNSGKAYVSNSSQLPGVFNVNKWNLVGDQYDIFYVNYPVPLYDNKAIYNTGDRVYWQGYTYTCARPTVTYTNENVIQFPTYASIPQPNVFPDSTSNSTGAYWNNKTAYGVAAGTLPTNTTYWVAGDNRSSQMVMYMADICVYHLHRNIAPQNIPELRKEAYKCAISWLKMCAMGDVTPNLPLKQPTQGLKIRYGGSTRMNNRW